MRKFTESDKKVYFTTVKGNRYQLYRRVDLCKTSKNKSMYRSDQPYSEEELIDIRDLKKKGLRPVSEKACFIMRYGTQSEEQTYCFAEDVVKITEEEKQAEKRAELKWKKENRTAKQWQKAGRKPRKNAKKIYKEYDYFFRGKNYPQLHVYFNVKSTTPLTKEDKENIKEEKIRRKKEEEAKKEELKRQEGIWKTSWQWLAQDKKKVKEGSEPREKRNWIFNEYSGGFEKATKSFYYYSEYDTEEIDEAEFERLKALYIEKYGGWEKIDLENTDYNGLKWYNN